MGVDERMVRCHEENGSKMDRGRLPVSTSIPLMASVSTHSTTMDTGNIRDVPFGPRKRIPEGTPGLH